MPTWWGTSIQRVMDFVHGAAMLQRTRNAWLHSAEFRPPAMPNKCKQGPLRSGPDPRSTESCKGHRQQARRRPRPQNCEYAVLLAVDRPNDALACEGTPLRRRNRPFCAGSVAHLADVLTAATVLFIKMADAPRGRGGFGRGRGDRGRGRRGPRRGGRKDEEKEWCVAVSDRAASSHIPAGSPSPSSVVL